MLSGLLTTTTTAATTSSFPSLHLLQSLSLVAGVAAGVVAATTHPSVDTNLHDRRWWNPLGIDISPAPSAEDGPSGARDAVRDPAYLPAQISAIVGSYAFSLVLVAITLLILSKRRRERIKAAEDFDLWEEPHFTFDYPEDEDAVFRSQNELPFGGDDSTYPFDWAVHQLPKSPRHVRNFSLPSPTSPSFFHNQIPQLQIPQSEASASASYNLPTPASTTRGQPGVDPDVDQNIVQRDRAMAQAQLEDMYKYVMEQEEAKEAGVEFQPPRLPDPAPQQAPTERRGSSTSILRKNRSKPAPANLDLNKGEKQSRASSILSALKSPGRKKKQMQGINISSPIMTPMSGTFPPQYVGEEMNTIPPRSYAPLAPPPLPNNHFASFRERQNMGQAAPMTPPDLSPESTQSIDERLKALALSAKGKERDQSDEEDEKDYKTSDNQWHNRHFSTATTEADPISAVSETSQAPLVNKYANVTSAPMVNNYANITSAPRFSGLPTSPKPGVNRFPSLPASPKPGQTTFSRPNAPSAVRTGGALPLRAYEPALMSPNTYDRTVKQTVFERSGPKTPGLGTARTPLTGNPVPYSPYQPYTPVVPITPSLVTKADRKRMKKFEARTPTLEMVKSDDEMW